MKTQATGTTTAVATAIAEAGIILARRLTTLQPNIVKASVRDAVICAFELFVTAHDDAVPLEVVGRRVERDETLVVTDARRHGRPSQAQLPLASKLL